MKTPLTLGFAGLIVAVGLMAHSAPAQETMRVAIPLFPTAAFPLLVANDRGFFRNEGLTVEPIRINSAPTTYQALISGDVHAVSGAPTGLLPSHAQGADVIALGSWDNLVPYVWVTREKIADIRELRGKKIGVNRAGSKPWLIVHVLLQDAGLDPAKDLTLLQMGGGSIERIGALMRGGIDATLADVLFEPVMKKRGFFVLRGKPTPFMNAPIAVKRSFATGAARDAEEIRQSLRRRDPLYDRQSRWHHAPADADCSTPTTPMSSTSPTSICMPTPRRHSIRLKMRSGISSAWRATWTRN